MEFGKLVEQVVEEPLVRARIDALVEAKREGEELDSGPREPVISGFIEAQMARLEAVTQPAAEAPDPACLDRLWHEILVAVNGPEPFGHPGGRAPA